MLPLSVPVMIHEGFDREGTLKALRAARARRVFLAIDRVPGDIKTHNRVLKQLKENIAFFRENGLEVSVWFWTFWLDPREYPELDGERMVVADGTMRPEQYCPASPKFVQRSLGFIRELAELGPDLLMFDDDYRFGYLPLGGVGCYCKYHMQRVAEKLGENVTRETLVQKIYAGKKNRFRDAWQEALGESLEQYAIKVRETVDSVNPSIRFALCSVMSLWDVDGTDGVRIAKLLAGGTKPLLRLIGAPYWAVKQGWGNRLAHIVELERMESAWCTAANASDMEIMPEGDVFPRPRHLTPANYLEGFDTAMRASGAVNASFKYMIDYNSSPAYENGYIRRHVRNMPLYERIEAAFGGKAGAGVRIYETMRKFPEADLSGIEHPEDYALDLFFSRGARMLVDNTIPTVYEGTGCAGIAMGENARHLGEAAFEKGLILDIRAARILMECGVDVGIAAIGEAHSAPLLYDAAQNEYVQSYYANTAYDVQLKDGVQVIGWACSERTGEEKCYPDAWRYENAAGQKFIVYAFDAAFVSENRWRSYLMQRQLLASIAWLGGEALPAVCEGNPDLYMICRRDEKSVAVGLWNFYADDVEAPEIVLDSEYTEIECIGCEGSLVGNRVVLSRIEPYGFAMFEVRREKRTISNEEKAKLNRKRLEVADTPRLHFIDETPEIQAFFKEITDMPSADENGEEPDGELDLLDESDAFDLEAAEIEEIQAEIERIQARIEASQEKLEHAIHSQGSVASYMRFCMRRVIPKQIENVLTLTAYAVDETGEWVGFAAIDYADTVHPSIEIKIAPEKRGMGYGYELVKAVVDAAFERYLFAYLEYDVVKFNEASRRIVQKLGGVLMYADDDGESYRLKPKR